MRRPIQTDVFILALIVAIVAATIWPAINEALEGRPVRLLIFGVLLGCVMAALLVRSVLQKRRMKPPQRANKASADAGQK